MNLVTNTFFILLVYLISWNPADARYFGDDNKATAAQDCTWQHGLASDFPQVNPPLIVDADAGTLVLPVNENNVNITRVTSGTLLAMACSGELDDNVTANYFTKYSSEKLQDLLVECNNGKLSNYQRPENFVLKDMGCKDDIDADVDPSEDSNNLFLSSKTFAVQDKCGPNNRGKLWIIDNKYTRRDGRRGRYRQMTICFDPSNDATLWVMHKFNGINFAARDKSPSSAPGWNQDKNVGFKANMKTIYTIKSQKEKFGNNYILDDGKNYFAHGHLATARDFVKVDQICETYHVLNAVPQWQEINNGNWGYIERSIQKMGNDRKNQLTIVTGGFGIWKDSNLGPDGVFLAGPEFRTVPIPEKIWKIVVQGTGSAKKAVAFVVSNIPKLEKCPTSQTTELCTTLQGTWLSKDFDLNDARRGCIDCYTIQDFRAKFTEVSSGLPAEVPTTAPLLN